MNSYILSPQQRRWLRRRQLVDRIEAASTPIMIGFGLIVFSVALSLLIDWTSP